MLRLRSEKTESYILRSGVAIAPILSELAAKIRDGLFLAASRTYGEQYIEPFVRAQYGLDASSSDHDGIDPATGERYEIKTAKALVPRITAQRLLTRILAEVLNTELHRVVSYADRYTANYNANIQNVKRDHFDYLIYVVLFREKVAVFQVPVAAILKESVPYWSDKHGRYDALGKSGQFNINKNSILVHETKFKKDVFTYEQLAKRFETL